jgi:hypothetical protein
VRLWQAFARVRRHHIACLLAASLLLYAAGSKWQTLAHDAVQGNSWWQARSFLVPLALSEAAFGLWLMFGLHRRASWLAAMLVFLEFALFSGFLYLRGERTCPCLGRHSNPALIAGLDLLVVLGLALCPPPSAGEATLRTAPWRACLFAFLLPAVALPAAFEMVSYSHDGLALDLRADPRLHVNIGQKVKGIKSEEILAILHESTGLEFTAEERLLRDPPDYGVWSMGQAWSVMLGTAQKQTTRARWESVSRGYRLVAANPGGVGRAPLWLATAAISACSYSGLVVYSRKKRKNIAHGAALKA